MTDIQTINPSTGKVLNKYPLMSPTDITEILTNTHAAYLNWHITPFSLRKQLMLNLKAILLAEIETIAQLVTTEMGKPLEQARAEISKCAVLCGHYAEHAEAYLKAQEIKTDRKKSYICYQPIGIVFAIMPWNFPVWQVLRFLVPALMAGNAGILRHADCCTGTGLLIEKLVLKAGFPAELFRSVVIDHAMAASIIADTRVRAVTLTGSERAGRAVAAEAGQALKKVVLELGGSDPYLILADADLQFAAEICVKMRMANCGQICISPKRLIVAKEVYDEFLQLVLKLAKNYQPSDPMQVGCQMGPMARNDLRVNLQQQIDACVQQGATILLGGKIPAGPGFYYPPTVITNIKPGMPAYSDELFGPVLALFKADSTEDAIRLANDVRFGLGAGVFTRDEAKGEEIARYKLNAGACVVNSFVASDPRMCFGGTKSSGFGRELGPEGIHEFVNIKSVCID